MTIADFLSIIAWLTFSIAFGIAGVKRHSVCLLLAAISFGISFILRILLAVNITQNMDWGRLLIFSIASIGVSLLLARLRSKNGIG